MHELGCTVDYDGTIKSREQAERRLYLLGGAVCVLIVLLLAPRSAACAARRLRW